MLAQSPASAQTMTLLQSVPIVYTCIAQDKDALDAYLKAIPAPPANEVGATREQRVQRMRTMLQESPWAACVRRKQWISAAFCRDILEGARGGRSRTVAAMEKHTQEIGRLKPMFDYFEAAFPVGGEEQPNAPACPG